MLSRAALSKLAGSMLLILVLGRLCSAQAATQGKSTSPWEQEIRALETRDRTNPPPAHPILFIGSSSIRLWGTLADDFRGLPVLNHGFGGSQIADSTALADRLVFPVYPRQIVLYAGDNDIAAGKSPETVLNDFQHFVQKVRSRLPQTPIAFLAIKPSPSRWKLVEQIRRANSLVAEYAKSDPTLEFVDVFSPMLGQDGKPREDLFIADKLHLSRRGYQLWASLIRPHLVGH